MPRDIYNTNQMLVQCTAMSRCAPRISVGYGCGTELRIELRTYIVISTLFAVKYSRNVEELLLLHCLEIYPSLETQSVGPALLQH